MISKIKIICTLGPSSFKKDVLRKLKKEKIDLFRINLSHTKTEDIEKKIIYLKKNKIKNICLDTEGAQVRTTETLKKNIFLKRGLKLNVLNDNKKTNRRNVYLYPGADIHKLKKGTKISIGFKNLVLKVVFKSKQKNCLICKVIKEGSLESKKGVHFSQNLRLPSLTEKDKYALKISKKYNLKYFAISFVNFEQDIEDVKNIVGKNKFLISKIETNNAIKNIKSISKKSNALLIDRGDLSRYIPIEKIPKAQEQIVYFTKKISKPTYVATNLLETMINESEPTRAESHDIYSTLKQGANGLVLAAETAIGKDPVQCIKFLKKCIYSFFKKTKYINF